RYLRLARLPHADQGGLPLPRFDPGGADCARPGALPRPGTARRATRHPGVAELLFQVADVRAGALSRARSVHPVDEAEEYVALAARRGLDHPPRRGILRLTRRAGWRGYPRTHPSASGERVECSAIAPDVPGALRGRDRLACADDGGRGGRPAAARGAADSRPAPWPGR